MRYGKYLWNEKELSKLESEPNLKNLINLHRAFRKEEKEAMKRMRKIAGKRACKATESPTSKIDK